LVLPIGGLKEKVLAARRAGIHRVVLPQGNKKDLRELPDHVRQEMQFHFVDRVEQVLSIVIPNLQMKTLALAS
jgi:ATP-dependent Lon protease